MNYTNSGIIAEGAPNSHIRVLNEINLSLKGGESNHHILLLTVEGQHVVDDFLYTRGCLPKEMDLNSKSNSMKQHEDFLESFLKGVRFGMTIP